MFSERILFIIERIPDILNVDKERKQILTLCEELSHDERKVFLELHSDYMKRTILKRYSDEEIRKILELCSEDEKKEILEWYVLDAMEEIQQFYLPGDESSEFLGLYLPGDKSEEFKKMYRELSDDDKQEFLHKYNESWRYKILKYLEFRQRWFHKHDAGTLFEIITFLMEGKEVVLSKDVKEGIGELQKGLLRIYNYLRDVEAKYNDRQVFSEYEQQFYNILSSLADTSDDLLDRVMSNDVIAHDIDTLLQTIHNFYSYNLSSTQFKLKVVVKDNINSGGPQSLANMKFSINRSMPSKDKQNSRPKSYGHVPNPDLVGFDGEIQILLNFLIQPLVETRVVGIVGTGGAGKTTLAKHIYHHPEINSHFASKVWVCISQSWDKTTILNSIWRQAAQNPKAPEMGYDQLVDCLSELLSSLSYLVILDDIWSVDAWYDISPALLSFSGSKVVVTTRNKFLPQLIDPSVLIVEPKQLNDEECYELFKKRALLDENVHDELQSLGVEMVKKCKGLPLAVVALAGVLGIDKRLSSWERISKRVTDKMLNMANDSTKGVVKEILALSYYELGDNLKPCALYLRVFPEDYVIEAKKLIQMWIAERFIDEEYVAEEYLDEMAQRCIVEVVKTNYRGQVLEIRIHDLIREMFINIDKERDILKNPVLRLAPRTTIYGDGHGQKDFDSHMKILDRFLYGNSHVRSLIFFNFQDHHRLELQPLFIKLKLLRVLILEQIDWIKLPEEIGNLIHLRYLELNGSSKLLSGSIGNLENLLTLNLGNLGTSTDETINLEKLKELRHLYMQQIRQIRGLEKLKKLKTLWGAGGEWMLSMMPKLSDVLQEIWIQDIRKEKELEVVFRTPSITSNNLRTLVLNWNCRPICELRDMSILSKCESLTTLKLEGKIQEGTPLMFPPNLVLLEMTNTAVEEKQVMNIISESCPLLKILIFGFRAYSGSKLVCNKNSFPQLEMLALKYHYNLKRWIVKRGAMPRLNHLILTDCTFLDLNDEGWKRIAKIPELTFLKCGSDATIFEDKLQQWRNDWIHCIKTLQDFPITDLYF